MPDTFASKTAALQDDSADAAIGNITGSNSVNVFLGLGLPWVIKATYLYSKNQKLEIQGENLLFAVLVFLSCGFVTLLLLVLRRVFGGGELGGSPCSKFDHFHTLRFRCAPNEM
uniref:Sodium/calcium exchanger membrane region domain-containing protein n=2 Tax=Clytia hemisphaerica TaxID=252671 RepID=A0A7M5V8V9_9CNID